MDYYNISYRGNTKKSHGFYYPIIPPLTYRLLSLRRTMSRTVDQLRLGASILCPFQLQLVRHRGHFVDSNQNVSGEAEQ
jgi:hypothetical protein